MEGDLRADLDIMKSHEEMCHRAAELFGSIAKESIEESGRFTVALAGGSTPAGLYIRLHAPPYELDVEWAKAHIFFSDERCVGPEDSSSNYRMAHEALLQRVYMDEENNVHRIKGELGPDRAAEDYEAEIGKVLGDGMPRFDLVLLGIGADGHTASLFPGSSALVETKRPVAPVHETEMKRVTLTFPAINSAKNVIFMATGTSKAEVVAEVLEEGNPRGLPSGLIRPEGRLLWLLDTRAASGLEEYGA
jgi:6-phosphogluconolactonase